MGIDPILLRDQCRRTLGRTDFQGLGRRIEGKVRDCYVQGDRRVLYSSLPSPDLCTRRSFCRLLLKLCWGARLLSFGKFFSKS